VIEIDLRPHDSRYPRDGGAYDQSRTDRDERRRLFRARAGRSVPESHAQGNEEREQAETAHEIEVQCVHGRVGPDRGQEEAEYEAPGARPQAPCEVALRFGKAMNRERPMKACC
jgi:hypothetical protein